MDILIGTFDMDLFLNKFLLFNHVDWLYGFTYDWRDLDSRCRENILTLLEVMVENIKWIFLDSTNRELREFSTLKFLEEWFGMSNSFIFKNESIVVILNIIHKPKFKVKW